MVGLSLRAKPPLTPAYTVSSQDVRRTIISTGTVTSHMDLSLSFKTSGILKTLNVKVGDKVKEGQLLASLDDADAGVSVAQAQSQLLSAQATYDKLINGASGPDIDVSRANVESAKTTLSNAEKNLTDVTATQDLLIKNSKESIAQAKNNLSLVKNQQDQLVKNAYNLLLNSGLEPVPVYDNATGTPTVTGVYDGSSPSGTYIIKTYLGSDGVNFTSSGLGSGGGALILNIPLAIGHELYITFSSTPTNGDWTIDVPNTQSSGYVANQSAYQTALQTQTQAIHTAQTTLDNANIALQTAIQTRAQAINTAIATIESARVALQQANAAYILKISAARSEDVAVAKATVAQAQSSLALAQNTLSNLSITSPISGLVTIVAPKLGEQIVASKEVVKILDDTSLHVESYIPESSIATVSEGQVVEMTLDALGPEINLSGKVISIDPAATVMSGVIEFRVITSLPVDERIKAGMTANLTVITGEKKDVMVVPNRLIASQGTQESVMILREGIGVSIPITTGLMGDNYTEVLSGISNGDLLLNPVP